MNGAAISPAAETEPRRNMPPSAGAGELYLQKLRGRSMTPDRSPFLLFDVRITQGDHNERGISRYSTALALSVADRLPGKVAFLLNPDLPAPEHVSAFQARGRIIHGDREIASLSDVTHFIQCCLFELDKTAEQLFPIQLAQFSPQLWMVAYDLIPKIYAGQYLESADIRRRYLSLMNLLPVLDGHLAISETTARDLVRVAGVRPDRITTIYGSLDELRWRATAREGEAPAPRHDMPDRPFWLYVGGGDFRKNIEGLIAAFAELKQDPASSIPVLVVLCNLYPARHKELEALARQHGLKPGQDLIFTGQVDDEDMMEYYRRSFAVVFPSLYEGLGLPILEAYFFDTPVLAGDNSSLREITPPECRFNAEDPNDISRAMLRFETEPELRSLSLEFGAKILKEFDWPRVAARVVQRFTGGC